MIEEKEKVEEGVMGHRKIVLYLENRLIAFIVGNEVYNKRNGQDTLKEGGLIGEEIAKGDQAFSKFEEIVGDHWSGTAKKRILSVARNAKKIQ